MTSPTVTFNLSVDMSAMKDCRAQLAAKDIRVSYTALLVKFVAQALTEYPLLNCSVEGEQIRLKHYVNMGVAVALPEGLVVPHVADADKKGLRRSRGAGGAGPPGPEAACPWTSSGAAPSPSRIRHVRHVSFSPIINQPEAAILGVTTMEDRPVVRAGEIVVRPMMTLSLTADHRVVDGSVQRLSAARQGPAGESRADPGVRRRSYGDKERIAGQGQSVLVIAAARRHVAAIRAAQLGAQVTLVERDELGGTCLNRGCMSSKTLLHSTELYYMATHSEDLGVIGRDVELDWRRVQDRLGAVVQKLTSGVGALLRANRVTVVRGEAVFTGPKTVQAAKGAHRGQDHHRGRLPAHHPGHSRRQREPGMHRLHRLPAAGGRPREHADHRRRRHRPGAGQRISPLRDEGHRGGDAAEAAAADGRRADRPSGKAAPGGGHGDPDLHLRVSVEDTAGLARVTVKGAEGERVWRRRRSF
jgi:hypothetical protein